MGFVGYLSDPWVFFPVFLVGSFCGLFLGVLFWALGVLLGFCGLVLVAPVYLGAPYTFINKILLTYRKKGEENGIVEVYITKTV
jgi:hypothetical protein